MALGLTSGTPDASRATAEFASTADSLAPGAAGQRETTPIAPSWELSLLRQPFLSSLTVAAAAAAVVAAGAGSVAGESSGAVDSAADSYS